MVSTVASGDTSPYVGSVDVTMMYSVVDIAGRQPDLGADHDERRRGARRAWRRRRRRRSASEKPLIAASMFGVTTPAVTTARERLEELGYEVLVFHQTGAGGGSMEELIKAGFIAGSLDVTTTEFCDLVAGGVLAPVPERLESAGRRGIPQVVSLGALDMVNFGPLDTVPERYRDRNLYVHNPTITLMRTTPEECREIGRIIAREAERGDRADRAVRPAARRLGDRDRGPGRSTIPRPTRRCSRRSARRRSGEGRGARDRRRRQRSGVRARDGEPAARADRGGVVTRARRSRGCARRSSAGSPIIGAGAGTGLSAKCAEAGGADLIIIYNSGRFRMGGRGSLAGLMPYGDANAIVVDMAREVLPVVQGHARARRRLRHRPVPVDAGLPARAEADRASAASRTSRPSA